MIGGMSVNSPRWIRSALCTVAVLVVFLFVGCATVAPVQNYDVSEEISAIEENDSYITELNPDSNKRFFGEATTIAAGGDFAIGVRSDGTVVAVGSNEAGQLDVSDWRGIKLPFEAQS